MTEEELLKYMTITDDKVIIDKVFYENVIVKCMNNSINEKKQLISFLEDKIKELKEEYGNYVYDDYSVEKATYDTYQEVLDFIEKGGK